jgi:hypothetical protein
MYAEPGAVSGGNSAVTPTLTPADRLKRIEAALPEATELARALSLAVRAEPELVRRVRLMAFPRSGAWLEADLYFSPLVRQRTPDWIVLDPQLALELQEGLAQQIRGGAGGRLRIVRIRQAIEQAHSQAPSEIGCEEEVTWLAVERRGGIRRAQAAIDRKLRAMLPPLVEGSEQSLAIARWFASAARRLPKLARETQGFNLLKFAASSTLAGRTIEPALAATKQTFDELSRYLPESARRIQSVDGSNDARTALLFRRVGGPPGDRRALHRSCAPGSPCWE